MEKANAIETHSTGFSAMNGSNEQAEAHGFYTFDCHDENGNLLWSERLDNVVCTQGKNVALNAYMSGSPYTVVGPFMGLITSTSFTATAATDTMAGHPGWLEGGNANAPTYSGTRPTLAFSAASGGSISTSSAASYTFTGSGTVQGAFVVFGSGAVNTVDNTGGNLYSAGAFAAAQPVISGNVLTVNYTTSI